MSARRWLAGALLGVLGVPLSAAPAVIEVFTAADRPVAGAERLRAQGVAVTVYRVDTIARANARLSLDLPGEERAAARVALARIARDRVALGARYARGARALLRALEYGLDRYPAVVLDGAAVVYGITDLEAATAHYTRWQAVRGQP